MKKAQAAAETLAVYGFAILILTVTLFSLYYFGVLNFKTSFPSMCTFPAGLDCIDMPVISSTEVILALRNNQGARIQVNDLESTGCKPNGIEKIAVGKTNNTFVDLPVNVGDNDIFKVKIGCDLTSVERLKSMITVRYTNLDSGLSNAASGEVKGNVV